MNTENEVVKEFRQIKQEYAFNRDIFSLDDPKVARLKEIIETKLSQVDRTIILLYADCQSFRELGRKMNLSHMTCYKEISRIRRLIIEEYDKMTTEWRPVKGYEGLYEVSNKGEVRSLPRQVSMTMKGVQTTSFRPGKVLRPQKTPLNYQQVVLSKDNRQRHKLVHRLVAEAFIPNPNNLPQINHLDECPGNNRVENLEWCTAKENGSYGKRPSKYMRKVEQYSLQGEKIATYRSLAEAAAAVGCSYTHISHCCKEGTKEKTAKGFIWKYADIH